MDKLEEFISQFAEIAMAFKKEGKAVIPFFFMARMKGAEWEVVPVAMQLLGGADKITARAVVIKMAKGWKADFVWTVMDAYVAGEMFGTRKIEKDEYEELDKTGLKDLEGRKEAIVVSGASSTEQMIETWLYETVDGKLEFKKVDPPEHMLLANRWFDPIWTH